jgi:hypothetical protein
MANRPAERWFLKFCVAVIHNITKQVIKGCVRMKFNRVFSLIIAIITLTAIGLSCTAPAPTLPQQNRPPVIEQVTGSTDWAPGLEGEIACTAIDPDGDKLTYRWTADNGTIKGEGASVTWTSPATMGKYNITVKVTDSKGLESTYVKEVKVFINSDGTITPDAPIVLNLTLPSKDVVTAAKRIRIWTSSSVECRVEGAGTKILKYTWTPSNGRLQAKGLAEGTASKVTWIAPGVAGDFTLDVIVADDSGNEAKGTVNFKVFCCGN